MKTIRYTLLTDGPSDRSLIPIINWLLDQYSAYPYESQFPEQQPALRLGLEGRIRQVLVLYPCELLLVHRDAERESYENRAEEIASNLPAESPPSVFVIPIRMTEAWLLTDAGAIRAAADNPAGSDPLALPRPRDLEKIPDPKNVLNGLLETASGLTGRRLRRFQTGRRVTRVAELTNSFAALRTLSAFQSFEEQIKEALRGLKALAGAFRAT